MDYKAVVCQLVRSLRGARSQATLSRKVGYSPNAIHAWERGRRRPSADVIFQLAQRFDPGAPVRLADFFGLDTDVELGSGVGIAHLVNRLSLGRSAIDVARGIGKDRSTLRRWTSGLSQPKADELLALIDFATSRLLDFLSLLVDPSKLPATRSAHRDLSAQRRLAYDHPWSPAVLRALELSDYRALPQHVPGFIAKRIGIPMEAEIALLAALVASKQVAKRRGCYRLRRVLTIDTRTNPEANRELKRHWARVALERYSNNQETDDSLFSYNVFATDQETYQTIRALHLEYYQRVRELVASAAGEAHRVVLLNMQLVPLNSR